MKKKLTALREILEANKIFFEVIVASLLSFMAVYVSIQANKIAEGQTRIMEEENLPQIEIRRTQEYNDQIKIYDNNVWLFYNRGGRLSDFDTEDYSFFRFTYRPNYDTLILPIYSYLNMQGTLSGESEGLIYQIDNYHQGIKELELRDSLSNYGFHDIDCYMMVSYTDIFDKKHHEYYVISPGVNRISKDRWEEAKARFQSENERYTFSKLSASSTIEMIK